RRWGGRVTRCVASRGRVPTGTAAREPTGTCSPRASRIHTSSRSAGCHLPQGTTPSRSAGCHLPKGTTPSRPRRAPTRTISPPPQKQSGPTIARRPAQGREVESRSVLIARLLLSLVPRRLDVAAQLDIALVARVLVDL